MSKLKEIQEVNKNDISKINQGKLEFRRYQKNIADNCIGKNSLVVLPTGLGKTIIAVLVAAQTLELFPQDSKVIILAPTRPLINQHYDTFSKFLSIPPEKFEVLTGKTSPEKRTLMFKTNNILFYTPQTLRNDLVNKRYNLENTCLLIFDEAHHASGDYPYSLIADKYIQQNPDGTILALTASPGASKKKVSQLCENLHIPLENIHIRSRKDTDVKEYLKPMDIYKMGVSQTSLMEDIYAILQQILEERLQYLSQLNFLDIKSEQLFKKIFRKDLLRLNGELVNILKGTGDKTGVYSAISINAQALILYHMIELVEQQGLDILLLYLEKVNTDAKKKTSSKAIKILSADARLRRIYIELKKNQQFSPEKLIHPKYDVLEKVILDEIYQKPESRILVFTKLRDSVRSLVKKLKNNSAIKPVRFVGQATKSKEDKGLSQKTQIEILEQFKNGEHNVLVSTNVGEEGLDIAECDLVIFYDVVASEIRLIQRKGRTARHREGRVVILYCKGTTDEIYLNIALNKLKKMNATLKKPNKKRKFSEQSPNQSDLGTYINEPRAAQEDLVDIDISNTLPMKYGLRKKLKEGNISFKTIDSSNDVVIFNKIVLRINNPKESNDGYNEILIKSNAKLRVNYDLIIYIYDFIDYAEDFEGEKRLLKNELQKFSNDKKIPIITIDNPEELFFIIKNIYIQNIAKSE